MTQVITLTPSEFMLAVHEEHLTPSQLVKGGGASTDVMRKYFQLDEHKLSKPQPVEVLIDGRCVPKLTITPSAALWVHLINHAEAELVNGVSIPDVIHKIIDLQFKQYLYTEVPHSRSIRNLFDVLYHHFTHFNKGISLVSH